MSLLERNLAALAAVDPGLASELRAAAVRPDIVALRSGAGLPVPARKDGERERVLAYHSTVDPLAEGARFRRLYPDACYCIFLGLGGGYQTRAFLAEEPPLVQRLVIIESDPGVLRAVMTMIDLAPLLSDPRVRLLPGRTPEQIRAFLAEDYLPLRDGDLQAIPLRPAFEADRDYFAAAAEACRDAARLSASDTAVQAKFGRRWFLNTVANLAAAQESAPGLPSTSKAVVLAAGPSLESQLPRPDALRRRGLVIAADTALPYLLAADHKPDLVVSLDCQHVSYHHFLQGLPADVSLALDLASPPLLSRLAERKFFFAGGHPFSRYLAAFWRPFPFMDTSGGNVTQAAVSLARLLGAEEIFVLGADFSYPAGKAYARGTYLFPYYRSRETRCRPLESLFFGFLRRGGPLTGGPGAGTTPLMETYRRNLFLAVKRWGGTLRPAQDGGLYIRLPRSAAPAPALPAPDRSWREFLESYSSSLLALPTLRDPLRACLAALSPAQRDLWTTQLPAAAAMAGCGLSGASLLERTRGWSLAAIRRVLDK